MCIGRMPVLDQMCFLLSPFIYQVRLISFDVNLDSYAFFSLFCPSGMPIYIHGDALFSAFYPIYLFLKK